MNITSVLKLATALAFTVSAHSEVVFFRSRRRSLANCSSSANFNAVDENGVRTYPYDTYGNTDAGSGAGWGGAVVTNFDGTTPVANPGDQNVSGVHTTTTWMGPSFYGGLNREVTQIQAGAIHSHGNGFRIRVNIGAALIDDQGVGPTGKRAVFTFDADTSSLSEAGDNLIFGDSDTFAAKLAVPAVMGPNGDRASAASYRAIVKADGEYYAGPLFTVDLSQIGGSTEVFTITESCADATWTLMPSMDGSDYDAISTNPAHPQNLTVDTSESATTVVSF